MTDWLLALVPTYGKWLLAACTFAFCLVLPVPASVLMLAACGFVVAGDLPLTGSARAAPSGAVAGDQLGFAAGRHGRAGLIVFLSRLLVSALGPYVNLAAGAAGLPSMRFTL